MSMTWWAARPGRRRSSPPASSLLRRRAARAGAPRCTDVDWRPPVRRHAEADLAGRAGRPAPRRRPTATARRADARRRRRSWSTSGPAREVLGLEPGRSCTPARRSTWERASGPMRGALIGAHAVRGAGRRRRGGRAAARRRRRSRLDPCHHHRAVGPMAGVTQPVDVDVVLRGPGARRHGLLHPQRGPGQGAALRRLRPRGDRPAALDARRARPGAVRRRVARRDGPDRRQGDPRPDAADGRRGAQPQPRRHADVAARAAAGDRRASTRRRPTSPTVLRFIGGNDHFFLNLGMPACKLATGRRPRRPRLHDGRRDGPQRHRVRHPGRPAPATAGSPARRNTPDGPVPRRLRARTTPTPTSATRRSPRPPASAASRWPRPRRSSGSSAARCPTRWPPPERMYEITLGREPGVRRSRSWASAARPTGIDVPSGRAHRHPAADQHRHGRPGRRHRPGRRRPGHAAAGVLPAGAGRPGRGGPATA